MKNIILLLSIVVSVAQLSIAQNQIFAYSNTAGIWGYVSATGTEITPAEYRNVSPFSKDGYATAVNAKTKQGVLLNSKGELIDLGIKGITRLEYIGETEKNLANKSVIAEVGKKHGVVSIAGKIIHPLEYDRLNISPDGTIYAKKGTQHFILNLDGSAITLGTEITDVKDFTEGLAPYVTATKMFGFIDAKGNIVVPAQFTSVGYFNNGLAWAKTADRKVGFIDKTGAWIIPAKYDMVKEFDVSSKRAMASIGEIDVYLTPKGEEITVEGATKLGQFTEGLAYAFKGKMVGFVDVSGKWIVDAKYDKVHYFKNGKARVRLNEKWGYITKDGKEIIPLTFDDLGDFENGLAPAKQGTQWGIINEKGEFVVQPKYLKVQ